MTLLAEGPALCGVEDDVAVHPIPEVPSEGRDADMSCQAFGQGNGQTSGGAGCPDCEGEDDRGGAGRREARRQLLGDGSWGRVCAWSRWPWDRMLVLGRLLWGWAHPWGRRFHGEADDRARLAGEAGMATAEYAIVTVAAVGFAGVLILVLRSDEVRQMLAGIIRGALSV